MNVRGGTSSCGFCAEAVVEDHDPQSVEQLPLVLVDAFDLAVEDRVGIDDLAAGRLEPVLKLLLRQPLGLGEFVAKAGVVGERLELFAAG